MYIYIKEERKKEDSKKEKEVTVGSVVEWMKGVCLYFCCGGLLLFGLDRNNTNAHGMIWANQLGMDGRMVWGTAASQCSLLQQQCKTTTTSWPVRKPRFVCLSCIVSSRVVSWASNTTFTSAVSCYHPVPFSRCLQWKGVGLSARGGGSGSGSGNGNGNDNGSGSLPVGWILCSTWASSG